MRKTPLYQEIAESIRREILDGSLRAGESLPTVRALAARWGCAPGTVLRAYQTLADQGLVVSRPGAGTHVASGAKRGLKGPLRRATLMNQAEAFLLRAMSSGYSAEEVEGALLAALDRWRAQQPEGRARAPDQIRFAGSHDLALTLLAKHLKDTQPECSLELSYVGSLGGLIALARGEADLAGAHLWDRETGEYNRPFVERLLPGREVGLVTLADRHLGLLLPRGNPEGLSGLEDVIESGLRFVNRQPGAGTRIWLDAQLQRLEVEPGRLEGYRREALTHTEVASAILEGEADVGLGIQAAAIMYGLAFLPLTLERYELVVPAEGWERAAEGALIEALHSEAFRQRVVDLGGYEASRSGEVRWVG
jgi:molybdate-binding protein/DNA-binding transcriptional regulator YhcF (GntR family)